MNPLDARARSATSSIHSSVAAAGAPTPFATVVRRALIAKVINVALVGAGAAMFIAAGAAFRTPQPQIPVADTVTTSTTTSEAPPLTTTAAPSTSLVALPPTTEATTTSSTSTTSEVPVPSSTEPPATTSAPTTTTTTTAAPTTTTTTTTTKPPDTEPPIIEITFPENRQRFEKKEIAIRGITEPGATVTFRKRSAVVGDDGRWVVRAVLEPGRNRLTVTATDAAGNSAHDSVLVVYVPPDVAAFSAHAEFGSCSFDPPYDVYYGTGHAGTGVYITSEYGSGSTTINAEGTWEIKVFFPEAPSGKTFLVRATDEFGRSKTFEFTSYVGDGA